MKPNLTIGGMEVCTTSSPTIHACKHPCHQQAVNYQGHLNKGHPEYLIAVRSDDLYLNMVDMDRLEHEFIDPILKAALDFIDQHSSKGGKITIHCNQGISRAPSIAMLYLAKREKSLPGESFDEAVEAFRVSYPRYEPGRGISDYLRGHWHLFS